MIGKVAFPAWSDGFENENMNLWPTLTIKEPKIHARAHLWLTHKRIGSEKFQITSSDHAWKCRRTGSWAEWHRKKLFAATKTAFAGEIRFPPSQGSLIYRHCRQFWFIRMFRRGKVNTPWNENEKMGERETIARRGTINNIKARRDIEIERK